MLPQQVARRSFACEQMSYSASRREQPLPRRAPAAVLSLTKLIWWFISKNYGSYNPNNLNHKILE